MSRQCYLRLAVCTAAVLLSQVMSGCVVLDDDDGDGSTMMPMTGSTGDEGMETGDGKDGGFEITTATGHKGGRDGRRS